MHFVFHGELTKALSGTSELCGVTEHGSKRDISIENEQASLGLSVSDGTTTSHKLTHDGCLILSGNGDLNIHDRLENLRTGLFKSLSERILSCKGECKGAGIDNVSLAISKYILNTNDWVACLGSLLGALMESFFNCRNIFVRDILTFSLVHKLTR
jgi:hypothetical protein